ncbi:N-acyl homoserine lactonase family protein [Nonomuraea zeae]|uniref:N-acyl homoserine lactonase family protein n=1 Tax=Nonomuraea zeae TaxID=1642303 RepID=A0A5S4GKR2_9ACTN|nr:N-acyl homoserine lactonase family protein [Nonomuraea zeae]TMR33477.1 N-acyl homoserine lactonase family protein [Nonomuraea zeae]
MAIKKVSVVSTGTVTIHPEHVQASGKPLYWWVMTSRRWTVPRPINVYVIEHDNGLVLFDTGQDRSSVTDPRYFPGGPVGLFYKRLARFEIDADQTLTAQLAARGLDIADVRTAIISHLHQDHIGGLRELAHAEIMVSAQEWATLHEARPELRGLLRDHIDLPGLRLRHPGFRPVPGIAPFTEGHDLFGDGSLVLVPTPGHTPGSVSLLVRRPGRDPLLMVGDLTYDDHLLREGHLAGVGEQNELRASTALVNEFRRRNPGLRILAAHDPGAAAALAAAEGIGESAAYASR